MKHALTISLLRQLISQSPWAQLRLVPYAGAHITWNIAGVRGGAAIDSQGLPAELSGEGEGVHLSLPSDRVHVVAQGMDALMREVRIEGNAGLASELAYLAKNLRPDIAEFLAPHIGDVLAEASAQGLNAVLKSLPRVGKTLADALIDYGVYEARLLVTPAEKDGFVESVDRIRDDVERLAARIQSLQKKVRGS